MSQDAHTPDKPKEVIQHIQHKKCSLTNILWRMHLSNQNKWHNTYSTKNAPANYLHRPIVILSPYQTKGTGHCGPPPIRQRLHTRRRGGKRRTGRILGSSLPGRTLEIERGRRNKHIMAHVTRCTYICQTKRSDTKIKESSNT